MSQPARKKRRTNDFFNVANFAATEADEGGDDEDWDDEVDDDIGADELERHRQDVERRYKRREEAQGLNSDIRRPGEYESRPNILDRLTQKYANNQSYAIDEQSIAESQHATHAQSLYGSTTMNSTHAASNATTQRMYHQSAISVDDSLPSVQDPNLWLVPCLPGKERYAISQLLKKYFKYLNHASKKLFIKTAFTTDMNTGYIYVEAFKEIHVRRACEDISGLNTWKLRLVPRNEMVDALTIKAAGPQIKRGQWCRFQRGLYKGDLAQVYAIMDQGSKVILRVVPRIDYGKLSIMNSQTNNPNHRQQAAQFMRRGRPPQKLFNKSEIEIYDDSKPPEIIHKDGILQTRIIKWRGKKYKNGCHLSTVPVNQVEFDVTAAPEEVQLLRSKTGDDDYEDDGDDELDEMAPPIFEKTCEFVRGDTVKVVSGAMTNLIGEVLTTQPSSVKGGITVTVLPSHRSLMEAIMFDASELEKYFCVGCHVKVKRGKFRDETGLIISVSDGEVIIFSDLTSRTIRVSATDITETSEVSTGRDVLGNYALYELVHLSRDVVGVIVSIQNGTFRILDNKDQIQQCRLPDILRHCHDEHAIALDIDNNEMRIGDVIIPQVGDFKQQRATVKHVYRSVLFCHTKSCTVNSGIFVVRSRLCRLAGGRMQKVIQMNGRSDTKNDRRLRILHKHRSSRDPWMHKTVKIKRGCYKGMIGIVCGCNDAKLNIELHAKCKKIQIKREDVKVINEDGTDIDDAPFYRANNNANNRSNNNRNRYDNRRAPQQRQYHSAQTPLVGVNTPAHSGYESHSSHNLGAMTPAIGSQTPAIGGQTPGYGGATPGYSHNDDHHHNNHNNRSRNNGSSAWNVGGMTPAHAMAAQTPISPMYNPHASNMSHTHEDNNNHNNMNNDQWLNSESEQGDIDKAIESDPYYFIIPNALLTWNQESVMIKSVDKQSSSCSIALPSMKHSVYHANIPLRDIQHTVSAHASNAKVKVVAGKLCGEIGSLIGIDNEEAVVQLSATTEVTIIAKKLVVVYIEPN